MTDQPNTGPRNPAVLASGADGPGSCPDALALAAYLDGGLPAPDRARIEAHVADCEDCYEVLRESRRTLDAMGPGRHRRRPMLALWIAAAAGLAFVVGGAAIWKRSRPADPVLAELVTAVGARRMFEPRLSGGFRFGPLVPVHRSGEGSAGDDLPLLAAAAAAQRRAEERPEPGRRRTAAAAYLLLGHPDRAIDGLEALSRQRPEDAAVLNDLAAAYLVRAGRGDRADDLPRALEAASRAVEIDPGLAEAEFNRALALEALNLRDQARAAWDLCIARGGEWAQAAIEHRRRLDEQGELDAARFDARMAAVLATGTDADLESSIGESVEAARLHFEQVLLPAAVLPGRSIGRVERFGRAFEQVTGDRTLGKVARHLAQADAAAPAYARFAGARRAYMATRWSEAEEGFGDLLRDAAFGASPLRPWADLHLGILDFHAGRVTQAGRRFSRLQARIPVGGQPLLRGRIEWMLGILALSEGRFADALRHDAAGAEAFVSAQDRPHAAYMASQAADVYQYLGRPALAWERRLETLRLVHRFVERPRRVGVLFGAADQCVSAELPRAAALFAREARHVAAQGSTEASRIEAELRLARALSRVTPSEAVPMVLAARHDARQVSDAALRERLAGEAQRLAAEVLIAAGDPAGEGALDAAIDWLAARQAWARAAPLHLQRGLLRARRGEAGPAREDLQRAAALTREMVSPARDLRVSHARLALEAYDRLLGLQLDAHPDPLPALAIAEARWQLADGTGLAPDAVRARVASLGRDLAPDVVVIAFVPASDELVSWVVRRSGVTVARRRVGRDEVRRMADDLVRDARTPGGSTRDSAARLAALLLEPQAGAISGARRLVVVPGGVLWAVPFGLLPDGSGAPLGERMLVTVAPSLSHLGPSRSSRPGGLVRLAALGFGSGASDLPPLPRVEGEVRRVMAAARGPARGAVGRSATKAAFARLASGATILHFAGHSILNSERPAYSSLIVSASDGGDDFLTAEEIARLDLRGVDVVTLSTCAAAATSAAYGEGGLSLARAFLAAGAGAVIAPLWDVSDGGMPDLMARLHDELAGGAEPAAAAARVLRWAETRGDAVRADARSLVVLAGRGALAGLAR